MIDEEILSAIADLQFYMGLSTEFSVLHLPVGLRGSPKGAKSSIRKVRDNALKKTLPVLDRQLNEQGAPKLVYSSILKIQADLEILLALQIKILSSRYHVPLTSLEDYVQNRIKGIDLDLDEILNGS